MTSPFPLPILFTAWTWRDGAGIAGEVIRRSKLGGFKTVAVELSENTGGDPGSSLDAQDVRYLKDAGLFVVGWGPVDARIDLELGLALDGWLPQVEGPGQRDALLDALKRGAAAGLPRALVTTYGGLDTTADVAALVKAWGGMPFTFVECYKGDGYPHNDIDRMLAQGEVYGFARGTLRALVGTYRGELPADYPGLTSSNYGGAYLEESMTDAQLRAFASTVPAPAPTPAPTPEPTVTNDSAERKAKIAAICDEWLANFGPAPLTRLGIIDRIAKSGTEWEDELREDVKLALDGGVGKLRDDLHAAQSELFTLRSKITAAKAALG